MYIWGGGGLHHVHLWGGGGVYIIFFLGGLTSCIFGGGGFTSCIFFWGGAGGVYIMYIIYHKHNCVTTVKVLMSSQTVSENLIKPNNLPRAPAMLPNIYFIA